MRNVKEMALKTKLILAFLVVGILPFAIIGWSSLENSKKALAQLATQQLESVREIKKSQIENYFTERQAEMESLMETVSTMRHDAVEKLAAIRDSRADMISDYLRNAIDTPELIARGKDVFDLYTIVRQYHFDTEVEADGAYDVTTPDYQRIWEESGGNVHDIWKLSGYSDFYLICAAHGHVMYSCQRNADLGTNLVHGPYKGSGLEKVWRKVVETKSKAIQDYEPYAPIGGKPAGFAAHPIFDASGELIGVFAVQFSLDEINAVMARRVGLGETGETYLVGPDLLMRSDSFSSPETHSVIASFAHPEKGKNDWKAVHEALEGKSGEESGLDFRGKPVLYAFCPLQVEDVKYALIAQMDIQEALCPKDEAGAFYFEKYAKTYAYEDVYLLDPSGYCFFTAARKSDYQTNFLSGEYATSNLGKLIARVTETHDYGLADFEPYPPSNNEPSAFLAHPLVNPRNNSTELVVAVQVPSSALDPTWNKGMAWGKPGELTWSARTT